MARGDQISKPEGGINPEDEAILAQWIGKYPRLRPAFERILNMAKRYDADSQQVLEAWEQFKKVHERESRRHSPAGMIMPLSSDGDPRECMPERTKRHAGDLAGMIYDDLIRPCVSAKFGKDHAAYHEIASTTVLHVRDTLQRINAADPMEEMLVGQALMTHARIVRLNHFMADATDIEQIKVLCEAADRASNTYRRQMAALGEYRHPKATPQFNQTNIASQQVIQNHVGQKEKSTNEQGLADANEHEPTPNPQAAIPTHAGGATITTASREEESALEAVHRPEDRCG